MRIAYDRAMKLMDSAPGRNRFAIASSIVLHLCALTVFFWVPRTLPPAADAPAAGLLIHIAIPPPRTQARQASRPPAQALRARPVRRPAVTVVHVPPHAPARPERSHLVTVVRVADHAPPLRAVEPAPAPETPAAAVAAAAPTAPPVSPKPAAAVKPADTTGDDGAHAGNAGLFSATYPPAPAQTGALDAIRAALPARARLRITVDENGHAALVDWLTPPPDAALADAIRAKLLALPYIPAECDGLPCAGIISLTT